MRRKGVGINHFGHNMETPPKADEATASTSALSSTGSSGLDDSYDVYAQNKDIVYTADEGNKVLRKIDLRLIPLLVVIYMLQVSL
jgi:hypothetical protein